MMRNGIECGDGDGDDQCKLNCLSIQNERKEIIATKYSIHLFV